MANSAKPSKSKTSKTAAKKVTSSNKLTPSVAKTTTSKKVVAKISNKVTSKPDKKTKTEKSSVSSPKNKQSSVKKTEKREEKSSAKVQAPKNKVIAKTAAKTAPVAKKASAVNSSKKVVVKKEEPKKKTKAPEVKAKPVAKPAKDEKVKVIASSAKSQAKESDDDSELKRRGRKKKEESEKVVNVAALLAKKNKLSKSKVKTKKSDDPDIEEENLLDEVDGLSLDLDDIDLLADPMAPVKRKPGRPAKAKDLTKTISFPPSVSGLRLPKREPSKPKKPLSDTLPGTGLAEMFSGGNLPEQKTVQYSPVINKYSVEEDKGASPEEAENLPSWAPRNWITREGERLVIRGQELLREEQYGKLEADSSSGVISPDEVDEVIRRIRESYKKKTVPKKAT